MQFSESASRNEARLTMTRQELAALSTIVAEWLDGNGAVDGDEDIDFGENLLTEMGMA